MSDAFVPQTEIGNAAPETWHAKQAVRLGMSKTARLCPPTPLGWHHGVQAHWEPSVHCNERHIKHRSFRQGKRISIDIRMTYGRVCALVFSLLDIMTQRPVSAERRETALAGPSVTRRRLPITRGALCRALRLLQVGSCLKCSQVG